jgi:DNA-binding NarL/FixJ family response regulator
VPTDVAPTRPGAIGAGRIRPTRPTAVSATLITNSRLLGEALPVLLAPYFDLRLVATCAGNSPSGFDPPNPTGHVVLVDAGIGFVAALSWTRYWRSRVPPALVIAIELGEDVDSILGYIEAGIGGYTQQGATAAELAQAIRWVQQGSANCSPRVAAALFARFVGATVPMPLTARELDVLRCINKDFSNQEIATALVIEVRTVKHHVHSILHKLQLRHRWEATRVAVERGWLALDAPDR